MLTYVPRWPLFVNLSAAILCLLCSTIYHNFMHNSSYIHNKLATLDYGGICMLIMGSVYPPIFYPYACEPTHGIRDIFMIIITFNCIAGFLSLLNDKLASPECRPYRGIMFIVLGFSSIFPLVYLHFTKDTVNISYFSSSPYVLGGFCYFFGAVIYVLRIPEKFVPKRFDIVGSSH